MRSSTGPSPGGAASERSRRCRLRGIPAMVITRLVIHGEPIDEEFATHLVDDIVLPLLHALEPAPPPPNPRSTDDISHSTRPSSASDLDGPDPKRWLALGIIAVAQLMVVLDASIVTIALPSAQHSLHISTGQPPMGGDGLHAGLRWPAAARRPDRRLHGPQAHVHHRAARLRRRVGPGRRGRQRGRCCSAPGPCRVPSPRCSLLLPSRSSR